MIGINPASDSVDSAISLLRLIDKLRTTYCIPTQSCVLAHVTTQMEAMRRGAPVDLVFQSIAGTEAANASFGVNLAMLDEAWRMARDLQRGAPGANIMYFETGQGSALSANAHHGVDQQTCEARAYAVARRFEPMLVNTVVGFIGPEYLYDGKQIARAGLEDHFCGKLLGLPMGCDICYTNHAEADQDDMDALLTLLATAGVNYIMGVPGADDIMLNYQSTSFHDALWLRASSASASHPSSKHEAKRDAANSGARSGCSRRAAAFDCISRDRPSSVHSRPRCARPRGQQPAYPGTPRFSARPCARPRCGSLPARRSVACALSSKRQNFRSFC